MNTGGVTWFSLAILTSSTAWSFHTKNELLPISWKTGSPLGVRGPTDTSVEGKSCKYRLPTNVHTYQTSEIQLSRFCRRLQGTDWSLKYLVKCCTGQEGNSTEHYTNEYKRFQTQSAQECTLYISFKLDWFSAVSEENICKLTSLKETHRRTVCCSSRRIDPSKEGQDHYKLHPHWKWRPLNLRLNIDWLWHTNMQQEETHSLLLSPSFPLPLPPLFWRHSDFTFKEIFQVLGGSSLVQQEMLKNSLLSQLPPSLTTNNPCILQSLSFPLLSIRQNKGCIWHLLYPPRAHFVSFQLPLSLIVTKLLPVKAAWIKSSHASHKNKIEAWEHEIGVWACFLCFQAVRAKGWWFGY